MSDSDILGVLKDRYNGSVFSAIAAGDFGGLGWRFDRVGVVRHHVDYDDSVLFSPWYAGVARFTGLYVFVDGVDGENVTNARIDNEYVGRGHDAPGVDAGGEFTRVRFDRYVSVSAGDVCYCVYADGLVSQLLLDVIYPTRIASSGGLASAIARSVA